MELKEIKKTENKIKKEIISILQEDWNFGHFKRAHDRLKILKHLLKLKFETKNDVYADSR